MDRKSSGPLIGRSCGTANTMREFKGDFLAQAQPTSEGATFPPWVKNVILYFILYRLNTPIYVVPIVVAAVYWLIPLFLSAWDGTLLSAARAESVTRLLGDTGLPSHVVDFAKRFAAF